MKARKFANQYAFRTSVENDFCETAKSKRIGNRYKLFNNNNILLPSPSFADSHCHYVFYAPKQYLISGSNFRVRARNSELAFWSTSPNSTGISHLNSWLSHREEYR